MNVREVMTPDVKTCLDTDSLNEAARIMWENDCGAVPVVNEAGKVVAMITDRDICMAAYTQGRPLWRIRVMSAASGKLVVARPDDSLHRAEELMRSAQVRRLPVIDGDSRLVGILSVTDLARRTPEFGGEIASRLVSMMVGICRTAPRKNGTASPAPTTQLPR